MSNAPRTSEHARLTHEILHVEDRVLLEGAMAAGALTALADQQQSLKESLMVQTVIQESEALRFFDLDLALSFYTGFIDRMRSDYEAGKEYALDAVERCSEDIEAAALIVRVGIAIAKADEVLDEAEVAMIEEICARIGIQGLDTLGLAGLPATRTN
ncbi:MAG: TerB family tellurite resistance protein [Myxococcota bacterium]|nr:TerB family tellurite resistance protein [Myxococcota bacterium]